MADENLKTKLEKAEKEAAEQKEQNAKLEQTLKAIQEEVQNINENLTEDELQKRIHDIKMKASQYEASYNNLSTPEEKATFLNTMMDDLGIPQSQASKYLVDENGEFADWKPSEIIQELGIYVISQVHKTTLMDYNQTVQKLVPDEMVENGSRQIIYDDFKTADEVKGYENVKIDDYNQGTNFRTFETFYCNKHIHKGYDMLSNALNDVVKTPFLWVSLMQNIAKNVITPIALIIYKYKLQLIANPFAELSFNGIDVTSIKADMTIDAGSTQDALIKFSTWFKNLLAPSRSNTPNEKWIPNTFKKDIITSPKFDNVIIPVELHNRINYEVKAGTFQLDSLELPSILTSMPYDKTFVEFGEVKGLNFKDGTYTCFLVESGAANIMYHYQAMKTVDTPKMKQVINQYVRLGKFIDKTKRIWKIEIKIKTA